jgi:ABC-2 type transport system permease protein
MNAILQSLLRILALTRKELLAILKDPRSLGSLLVPPIIQCVVFGYAASYDLTNIPYALCDESHSAEARQMMAHMDGTGIFHRVATVDRPEDIKAYVDDADVVLAITIGPDFEKEIVAGRPATIQIVSDGRNSNTAATALAYANTAIASYNAERRTSSSDTSPAISANLRAWYNPNLETRWSMVPSLIGTLTLLQTLLLAAMSVAREREDGTFDQLLVTPFRPFEIMCGKTIPTIIIGIIQATNVILVAQFWFHIPFAGHYLPLYFSLIVFLLAAVGLGLFVSSLAVTMQQAMLYSFVLVMPLMLLSGLPTPIENMPDALQYLTYLNPLRHCIDITRRIYLDGAGLPQVAHEILILAAIAAVTLTGSSWFFRRKLY